MDVLAHLSDPHLGSLPRPTASELFSKRALGFYNWHRRRKDLHLRDTLDALVADVKDQHPSHIAVTGDLVNIALPGEFAQARQWLDDLGSGENVSLVPGNHDFYVRRAAREPHSHWGDFMRGDNGEPDEFPFLRRRGKLAIVGTSSAIPTPFFMATGALGDMQIERIDALLAQLAKENVFRVVLIHHSPLTKRGGHFKRLRDAASFRAVLKQHGADLILHGHDHVHSVAFVDGPSGRIPVVGVPSASMTGGEADPASYNLYRIDGEKGAWRCEAISRGFRRHQDGVSEIARRPLAGI